MRLTGYQPQYFPRLHYIARVLDSDIFTISDHVQFVKSHKYPLSEGGYKRDKSFQADTLVKFSSGKAFLTVPVKQDGLLPINETKIAYDAGRWIPVQMKSMKSNYAKVQGFKTLYPHFEQLLQRQYPNLAALNTTTILWSIGVILAGKDFPVENATIPFVNHLLKEKHPFRLKKIALMSQTPIPPPDEMRDATDWIIETCKYFDADEYYSGGTAAVAYLDKDRVEKAGITIIQQDWRCKEYTQQFSNIGFISNLSILDLLFNEDHDKVQEVLLG